VQAEENNAELRRTVNRLQVELSRTKREVETLRKVNKRYKSMLIDQKNGIAPEDMNGASIASNAVPYAIPSPIPHAMPTAVANLDSSPFPSASVDLPDPFTSTFTTCSVQLPPNIPGSRTANSKPSSSSSPRRKPNASVRSSSPNLPAIPKLARLLNSMPMFWRNLESPYSVLKAVSDISERLLSDRVPMSITAYMLDPWLRASATAHEPKDRQPVFFYLGQGKTQLHVLDRCSSKAEPPCFTDLQALPARTRTALAVALEMPTSRRRLAVIQASAHDSSKKKNGPEGEGMAPRVLRKSIPEDSPQAESQPWSGFTDAHYISLQLVCNMAGGILEQSDHMEQQQAIVDRMQEMVEVAVAINRPRTLPDFEQRAKNLLASFFDVNVVRVLFYSKETDKLLISSANMRRRDVSTPTSFSLDQGIVGMCAKKLQVIHTPNVSQLPYVDAAADGLQKSGGRLVNAHAAMLCGPMVVECEDRSELLGILQLLEKNKKKQDFSAEDKSMFEYFLSVCAHIASRTLEVQRLTAQLDGNPSDLERILRM